MVCGAEFSMTRDNKQTNKEKLINSWKILCFHFKTAGRASSLLFNGISIFFFHFFNSFFFRKRFLFVFLFACLFSFTFFHFYFILFYRSTLQVLFAFTLIAIPYSSPKSIFVCCKTESKKWFLTLVDEFKAPRYILYLHFLFVVKIFMLFKRIIQKDKILLSKSCLFFNFLLGLCF